jgi:triphosphoribosyl-dephospho-CoA synthase
MEPSLGQCVRLACEWEVAAPKAGNVHRGRDFADLRYTDFLASAAAIAPIFDQAGRRSVGHTVLDAIRATRGVVSTNTNLGIVLLLAPLAAVPSSQGLQDGVRLVLAGLDIEDARQVFTAIRLARPGGLGNVSAQDVSGEPTLPLRQIMASAAKRDLIAQQYVNSFQDVFDLGLPAFLEGIDRLDTLDEAVIFTQLNFLAKLPDSLIARKRGAEEAEEARCMALGVLQAGWPETSSGRAAFSAFDSWLTALGNSRNPGTSADLVTACLFVAMREKRLAL